VAAAGHLFAQRATGSDAVGAIDGPRVAARRARGRGGTERPLERSEICRP